MVFVKIFLTLIICFILFQLNKSNKEKEDKEKDDLKILYHEHYKINQPRDMERSTHTYTHDTDAQ